MRTRLTTADVTSIKMCVDAFNKKIEFSSKYFNVMKHNIYLL